MGNLSEPLLEQPNTVLIFYVEIHVLIKIAFSFMSTVMINLLLQKYHNFSQFIE